MTVVAQNKHGKKRYIDNGWPVDDEGGHQHAVSEFAASVPGALSPFGDVTFCPRRVCRSCSRTPSSTADPAVTDPEPRPPVTYRRVGHGPA